MSSRSFCILAGPLAGLMAVIAVLSGCSTKRYRQAADNETYRIIQQVEQQVFGHTNAFSIDTRYSGRKPKEIPPAEIIDDRTVSNRFVINLDQALQMAVKNSREYQTQKEQLYLTALSLTGARYEFTPQFFGSVTAAASGTSADVDSISTSLQSRWGVDQLLKTGGRLSVTLANDLIRYFSRQGPDKDSTINVLSVDIAQPLLRGFGVNDPSVEALTQAERNVVYAIRSFSLYQQQFAVDTVQAYFNLVTTKDIVRNDYRNYTNRVETTRYLEARAVDRQRRSDVDDARNAELSARSSYINSLAGYLSALDSFKLRLGIPLPTALFLEDDDLAELIQNGITPVEIDRDAAFRICVKKQMDILNAIDQFEDSKRKVRIAADSLKADVSFTGNASITSARVDNRDTTNRWEGFLTSPLDYGNFDLDQISWNAGIRLNKLPFDRLAERNVYRRALVQFERDLRSLGLTLDSFKDRIDQGLRTVEQARLNYVTGAESLKVAERRVENNVMLLEAGRATIRDVREAQDELIQSQNRLATIYASYLNARLDLLLNIGVLDTQPKNFWLTDPLKDILTAEQRSTPLLRMPDDQVVPPETFLEPVL